MNLKPSTDKNEPQAATPYDENAPVASEAKPAKAWRVRPGQVIFLLLLGWLVYFFATIPPVDPCTDKSSAFAMAQEFVRDKLKSPSTAVFPSIVDDGVRVVSNGKCGFFVEAYVDSANGFGATLRSHYIVELSPEKGTDAWRLNDLVFKGQ